MQDQNAELENRKAPWAKPTPEVEPGVNIPLLSSKIHPRMSKQLAMCWQGLTAPVGMTKNSTYSLEPEGP